MTKACPGKKGVALFITLAAVAIVIILANIVINIMSNQGRLTHHQVSRIKAYYAAQAGMVYTLEMIKNGVWTVDPANTRYACHRSCIDSVSPTFTIPTDPDIPYNVQVTIYPLGTGGVSGTTRIDVKTDYTYTE
jgi:Tfp pilus assembly protein PilX